MTQLSDLYDADKRAKSAVVMSLAIWTAAPHPLHGVAYADGVILCGRSSCIWCRDYRRRQR